MTDKEYIERGALIKEWEKECANATDFFDAFDFALERVPAADVVEVRHGEWIKAGTGITERIVCSECNSSKGSYLRPPFCNQCGAKMDGERKEQA